MATAASTMKSVLRAHNRSVNGCYALPPSLDEASLTLRQAHAVLVLALDAAAESVVNPEIIDTAFRAVGALLETGIREMEEGHSRMAARVTRQ